MLLDGYSLIFVATAVFFWKKRIKCGGEMEWKMWKMWKQATQRGWVMVQGLAGEIVVDEISKSDKIRSLSSVLPIECRAKAPSMSLSAAPATRKHTNVMKCNACQAKGAGVNSDQARQRRATRIDCTPKGLAMDISGVRRMVWAFARWIACQKERNAQTDI